MAKENRGSSREESTDRERTRADRWRDRAVELAALAGFADPAIFSLRQLDLAARAKRREEWDRIAALRCDLRRLLTKNKDPLFLCDFNPTYDKEERAETKRAIKDHKRETAPKITGAEVFEMLTSR